MGFKWTFIRRWDVFAARTARIAVAEPEQIDRQCDRSEGRTQVPIGCAEGDKGTTPAGEPADPTREASFSPVSKRESRRKDGIHPGSDAGSADGQPADADTMTDPDLQLIEATAAGKESQRVYFEPGNSEARDGQRGQTGIAHVRDDAPPTQPTAGPENEPQTFDLEATATSAFVGGGPLRSFRKGSVPSIEDDDDPEAAQEEFEARLAASTAEGEGERLGWLEDKIPDESEDLDGDLDAFLPLAPASVEMEGADWEEFALYADEFDETPSRDELCEVQARGQLSRTERAHQQAMELGLRFGWDESGIAVLTDVFDRWWWSAAKRSMERELREGLEPNELRSAIEIRDIWANHPEFSMDFSRLMSHRRDQHTAMAYLNISWPLALQLVRTADGYADAEYFEHLLCTHFDIWYTSSRKRRIYQAFSTYVYFRFGQADRQLTTLYDWTFEPDPSLQLSSSL